MLGYHSRHPSLTGPEDANGAPWPPRVNLGPGAIAKRSTWSRIPDVTGSDLAAMHTIDTVAAGASHATYLNPLDPGTVDDVPIGEPGQAVWMSSGGRHILPARAGRR